MAASTLGRLALRRVAVKVEPAPEEPIVCSGVPWSRGLWGRFLPERRTGAPRPPGVPERRVNPTA